MACEGASKSKSRLAGAISMDSHTLFASFGGTSGGCVEGVWVFCLGMIVEGRCRRKERSERARGSIRREGVQKHAIFGARIYSIKCTNEYGWETKMSRPIHFGQMIDAVDDVINLNK